MRVTHARKGRAYSRIARARSQSAMEYLMTYGWAILIIAIVVVALFSLGVFNPSNFAPRAQPGLCQVVRNIVEVSLAGQCNGELPEYVAVFNRPAYVSVTFPSLVTFTVTGWFNCRTCQTDTGINDGIFTTYGNNGASYFTVTSSNDKVGASWDLGGGAGYLTSVSDNTWYFFAANVVYSSQSACFQLDGTLENCGGITSYNSIENVGSAIGYQYNCCTWGFNGTIANVQLYNTSLSNSSIQALYQEGIGGAPIDVNNLVGWWPLNGNVNDYSGNGNDGTATGVTYTSSWTSGYSAP